MHLLTRYHRSKRNIFNSLSYGLLPHTEPNHGRQLCSDIQRILCVLLNARCVLHKDFFQSMMLPRRYRRQQQAEIASDQFWIYLGSLSLLICWKKVKSKIWNKADRKDLKSMCPTVNLACDGFCCPRTLFNRWATVYGYDMSVSVPVYVTGRIIVGKMFQACLTKTQRNSCFDSVKNGESSVLGPLEAPESNCNQDDGGIQDPRRCCWRSMSWHRIGCDNPSFQLSCKIWWWYRGICVSFSVSWLGTLALQTTSAVTGSFFIRSSCLDLDGRRLDLNRHFP